MAFGAAFVVAALACVATCYCSSRRPKGAALLDDASRAQLASLEAEAARLQAEAEAGAAMDEASGELEQMWERMARARVDEI